MTTLVARTSVTVIEMQYNFGVAGRSRTPSYSLLNDTSLGAAASDRPDVRNASMDAREKRRILADLEKGQEVLLTALRGVAEDIAVRRPAPGRWSVLECVEHLTVAEDYLFSQVMSSHPSDSHMVNPRREALIVSRGLDRAITIQSPAVATPTGRFTTLAEAVQRFLACRERTILFVESCNEDLRSKLTTHPIVGVVNGYETLLMMAVHPRRHAMQVDEIKTALAGDDGSQRTEA